MDVHMDSNHLCLNLIKYDAIISFYDVLFNMLRRNTCIVNIIEIMKYELRVLDKMPWI